LNLVEGYWSRIGELFEDEARHAVPLSFCRAT
jgi:hypothetical protein